MSKFHRGYILARLSRIGVEWKLTDAIAAMKPNEGEDWAITYVTPIYGGWDLIVEVSFKRLEDLDVIVTRLRQLDEVAPHIEDTTTLVSSKPNYPFD